jgi:tetratricopeptide (TPR) repeat protein
MSALRWEDGLAATLRGREADLDAVLRWAEGSGQTVSVRLITGPGGAGKTRLAAEAALKLRERGWCAGFLPRSAPHGQIIDTSGRAGGGLLLVINYPEERPGLVDELFRHVADLVNPPIPIRFLLVSRRSFEDWRRHADVLGGRFGRQELAAPRPLAPDDAMAVLREAAERFAELTWAVVPSLEGAEGWLARSPVNRLPLMAMAAGVQAALTGRVDFSVGAPELMCEIARRERVRVRSVSLARGLGEFGLERLLGAAVLKPEGLDAARVTALGELDIASGVKGQALLDALATSPWWGPGSLGTPRLMRLEPDRAAAAFLASALLADPQPRLQDWLYAASSGTGSVFGLVLSRLAWDLTELSRDGRGAEPLEQALLAMIESAPERAGDFKEVGYEEGTAFSAAFSARVLEQLLAGVDQPADTAAILSNLANRLAVLGRLEEALAAAAEAVELYRSLHVAFPGSFTFELASSHNNLATRLSELVRSEEAFAEAAEAVRLYRLLGALPNVAMSISNLATILFDLDRHGEALEAADEAVRMLRGLVSTRPDTFTPDLAMALHNLANRLSDVGRIEQALEAVSEAVKLRRLLATDRPDAFAANLANSLDSMANRLSDLNRIEEAVVASGEAVELYRRLVGAKPDAFTSGLARALHNLANRL